MNDGGPAFPIPLAQENRHGELYALSNGMSLRDYFAAHALEIILDQSYWPLTKESLALAAQTAYQIADAMLESKG